VLATDPRVLLFDEPLSALDRNLRDSLKYSILDLQRRTRKTAIYVTHDQSEAFAISDRIVVMNAGRAEQVGTQTEIYLRPGTPFVAEFIGANNSLRGSVTSVDGTGEEERCTVSAGALALRCRNRSHASVGDPVLVYVRPEDLVVLHDGEGEAYENVVAGVIDRVIFEGPTAQLRVDVDGRELRVDVSGRQRLTLIERHGRVRLGFNDLTVIPAPDAGGVATTR
ncbi:MAG: ABC transporter ATP-binding protein, partial [Chloroflexota bacterium]|nr:ABC transporter ATP-binding protein [Chloroflexota bacterium]